MRTLGLEVEIDPAGNLIGRWRAGNEPSPVVMVGSHLDTVPSGGRFDGALGVIAAIHAVALLKEEGFEPSRPLWITAFMDEEGTRFNAALFGTEAITLAHQFQISKFVQPPRRLVGFLKRLAIIGGGHLRELTKRGIGQSKRLAQSLIPGHCVSSPWVIAAARVGRRCRAPPGLVSRTSTRGWALHAPPISHGMNLFSSSFLVRGVCT